MAFLLCGWVTVSAQLYQVRFVGNQRTKSDFLLQVMDMDPLQFDAAQLDAGIRRLKNLPILIDAEASITDDNGNLIVQIVVEEAAVVWPILSFGGVVGNRWFMVGVTDFNTGGRAIQSTAFYRNIDGEHNAYLSVDVPLIRETAFGYGIEVQRYAAIEPLFFSAGAEGEPYRYANFTLAPRVSYAFDYQHRVVMGVGYLRERYERLALVDPQGVGSFPADAIKNKYMFTANHVLNRIDVHTEQRAGWQFSQQFQLINDVGEWANPFYMYWLEGQYFVRLGALNFAARGRLGVADNAVNPFAPFVLDSQLNIRGAGNRVDRGTAAAVLNSELRYTVHRGKRFGLQAVGFSDVGNWRKPGGSLDELTKAANLVHFTGAGVRLFYTRSQLAVLRLDYGVNTQSTSERGWVIGVGQFF